MRTTLLAAAIALVLAGSAYILLQNRSTQSGASEFLPSQTQSASSSAPSGSMPGWSVYSNQQYHFSVHYPKDLQLTQSGGNGNALTVVFQDPATGEGFQVFVTPYDSAMITKQRFAMDEPSDIMQDPIAIVIDGTTATMFYSANDVMGDTREVWFINKGLLYEVTTYKQFDSWLSQIMSTWKFI